MGKFVMELVKRETHEEEKQALFFPGARTRPREFSLPSKKPCIFYAGCNINQGNPRVLDSGFHSVDSGFQVLVFSSNHLWDSGFLELYSRFQKPGFRTSTAKFSSGKAKAILLNRSNNREEKSLRHVAMVAKFLDDNKPISHLKSTRTISNFTDLIQFHLIWQILAKFSSRPYLSLSKFRKRKRQFLCCVHLLHNAGSRNLDVSCRSGATTVRKCTK